MPTTTNNKIEYQLTVNSGFITNSSSCIHWFDKRILKDPDVKTFIKKYELGAGSVGRDLMSRSSCASLVVDQKTFLQAAADFQSGDYAEYAPSIFRPGEEYQDNVIVIYGDEYSNIFSELCHLMEDAAKRLKIPHNCTDYN